MISSETLGTPSFHSRRPKPGWILFVFHFMGNCAGVKTPKGGPHRARPRVTVETEAVGSPPGSQLLCEAVRALAPGVCKQKGRRDAVRSSHRDAGLAPLQEATASVVAPAHKSPHSPAVGLLLFTDARNMYLRVKIKTLQTGLKPLGPRPRPGPLLPYPAGSLSSCPSFS